MSATQSTPAPEPRLGFGVTPTAVSDAADRADAMIREMAARQGQPPATPPAEAPQGEASVGTPEALPPEANAGGEGMQPTPGTALPAPPPAEAPRSASEVETLRAQIEALEQNMRTWRGRYETELPRERQMRQEAEAKMAALQTRLEALEANPTPTQQYESLRPEELEQYGEDMFAMVERYLMPKVMAQITAGLAGVNMRFERIEGNLTNTTSRVAKSEQDKFYDRLAERLPNWRTIDESQAFHDWLESPDPIFGEPYKNALAKSARLGDDAAVSKVFEAFLNQTGASGSQAPVRGATIPPAAGTGAAPTAPPVAESPSLADLAAPGKPSTAPTPGNGGLPGAKRPWTLALIRQFYADQAKGVYRDREAEALQIERDIALAQREGRVQG
jgi:hypothetical protein